MPPLFDPNLDPDLDSIIYLRILHHWEMGQNNDIKLLMILC